MHFASIALCITVVLGLAIPESHPHNAFVDFASQSPSPWRQDVAQRIQHAHLTLVARADPASDESWNKALCKGGTLVKAMMSTDKEAAQLYEPVSSSAQSKFTDFSM